MMRPFLLITIPLVLGIIAAYYIDLSILTNIYLLGILVFIYIVSFIRKKSNSIVFLLLFFALGSTITSHNLNSSVLFTYIEKDIKIEGTVHEIIWKEEDVGKYIVKVHSVLDGDNIHRLNEKTVLKVTGEKDLDLGDKIVFKGKLKRPLENTNPKLYNYRLSLLANKVYTTVNIRDTSIIDIDRSGKKLKYRLRIGFRDNVEGLFDTYLDDFNSSLMKGIVMGESSYLEEEDIVRYREMGLAHILAVSGLHIGIIAGFLIFLLSNLGVRKRINIIIVLSIIWFYGFLIGFPPSVLRASIMFSFLFYGQALAEPYDSINILFISFFILLLMNPMLIFNLGFQLSYTATFSILYFTPYINERFYPYKNRITYILSGLLSVYIGILPMQLYYFNSFSILGIFSNLIISPILSFALVLGGIMIISSYVFPFFNTIIGSVLNLILWFQKYLIDIIYGKGIGVMEFYSPSIAEFIFYYILVIIILKIIDLKQLRYSIRQVIFIYLIFFIVFNTGIILFDNSMDIDFIDVGQGDAILIRTRKGNYLVDTGGNMFSDFDIGENIVLPYLKKHGINSLDAVFITHFDLDHCKSLPLLMEKIKIDNILISYEDKESEVYREIENSNIPTTVLKRGDLIYLDKNIVIEVISPSIELRERGLGANNMSLVFNLSYYNRDILFTGDIERQVEDLIVDSLGEVYLLKVPHHGSKTSSTKEFLDVLSAEIGVISVGRNNFYNHPHDEVIKRYEDMGTKIYRTDNMGMIKLKLNEEKVEIIPFLKEVKFLDLIDKYLFLWIYTVLYYLISYFFVKIYYTREEELGKYEL